MRVCSDAINNDGFNTCLKPTKMCSKRCGHYIKYHRKVTHHSWTTFYTSAQVGDWFSKPHRSTYATPYIFLVYNFTCCYLCIHLRYRQMKRCGHYQMDFRSWYVSPICSVEFSSNANLACTFSNECLLQWQYQHLHSPTLPKRTYNNIGSARLSEK